jgi:hypothetical protein
VLDWFLHDATNWLRLVGSGGILAAVGVWVALHYALPSAIVAEITQKLPSPLRPLIKVLNKL